MAKRNKKFVFTSVIEVSDDEELVRNLVEDFGRLTRYYKSIVFTKSYLAKASKSPRPKWFTYQFRWSASVNGSPSVSKQFADFMNKYSNRIIDLKVLSDRFSSGAGISVETLVIAYKAYKEIV